MSPRACRGLIVDMDGLLRHYDIARLPTVAAAHGVTAQALLHAAFAPERLRRVVTGQLPHDDWVAEVGAATGSVQAAATWLNGEAYVGEDVAELVRAVRASGRPTAILTNGTTRTREHVAPMGLVDLVDHFVCTAELGVAKPDAAAYHHVCGLLGLAPAEVFFTDDTPANVDGAQVAGLDAVLFTDAPALAEQLTARGLLP